jgi:hypothetical protein
LNIRVAETSASRLLACVCFAVLRLSSLDCADAFGAEVLGEARGIRPKSILAWLHRSAS